MNSNFDLQRYSKNSSIYEDFYLVNINENHDNSKLKIHIKKSENEKGIRNRRTRCATSSDNLIKKKNLVV